MTDPTSGTNPPTDPAAAGVFSDAAGPPVAAPAQQLPPTPGPAQPIPPTGAAQRQTFVVRGVLWGIMLGLGLAIVAVLTTVISLDLVQIIIVFVVGVLIGTLWSLFGPAKK